MTTDQLHQGLGYDLRVTEERVRQAKRLLGLNGALRGLFSHAFTEVHAVREISFAITADEAVVYLGPNGAGKSAMIKVMIGILVSSAGSLSALGRESHNHRMVNAAEIGVVFGQRS